jgi:hypothetical protein
MSDAVRYTIYPDKAVVVQDVPWCCNVKPDTLHGLASGKSRTVVRNRQLWCILSDEEKIIVICIRWFGHYLFNLFAVYLSKFLAPQAIY